MSERIKASLETFLLSTSQKLVPEIESSELIWVVGLSGGVDSVVLTHALSELLAANPQLGQMHAIHVHHGLQSTADQWAEFCQTFCDQLSIPFETVNVQVENVRRQGVEAAARKVRYAAFWERMPNGRYVLLTAHHQDDQAETLLLNLFRGSGLRGLVAMPALQAIQLPDRFLYHGRPFLTISKSSMLDYATTAGLTWVEDPSNQDVGLRRNFIRHRLLPLVNTVWPQASAQMANASLKLAESEALLEELAQMDLANANGSVISLDCRPLSHLSEARQKNALRHWARQCTPSFRFTESLLSWVLKYLLEANPESHPQRKTREGMLRVQNQTVYWLSGLQTTFCTTYPWNPLDFHFSEDRTLLQHSIAPKYLKRSSSVLVRSIRRDELLRYPQIKAWFKTNKIVVWNRSRWPVIEINGELAAICGFKTFVPFEDAGKAEI